MAFLLRDRVKDTTNSTGTGNLTLNNSAPTGFQTLATAGYANNDTLWYCVEGMGSWEVGLGTYNTTGPALVRTTVLASSNAGAAVNFPAGAKNVFVTLPASGIGQPSIVKRVYTASTTWTKPTAVNFYGAEVEGIGGGAAGGGAVATGSGQASLGAGGGSGSYAKKWVSSSSLGATETVTIGAGGTPVSGGAGNNGAVSSFGSHISCPGGNAGVVSAAGTVGTAFGGFGGAVPTGGDINIVGRAGISSAFFNQNAGYGGKGGDSTYGAGGLGSGLGGPGLTGDSYGSGGGGAANGASSSSRAGGPGSVGIIIVTEHYF